MNKHTQEELNNILLAKKLNDFYLAIIENRDVILTDEEYAEMLKREIVTYGKLPKGLDMLLNQVKTNEELKQYEPDLMRLIYSFSQIRYLAILTMIDDDVYNIANAKYENLKRNKIICFDNLTKFFNDSNARVKIFTPEDAPQLTQNLALLDVDDASIIQKYEDDHIKQKESEDLTTEFFSEILGKARTLKKD